MKFPIAKFAPSVAGTLNGLTPILEELDCFFIMDQRQDCVRLDLSFGDFHRVLSLTVDLKADMAVSGGFIVRAEATFPSVHLGGDSLDIFVKLMAVLNTMAKIVMRQQKDATYVF